ncbi:hypothetical protein DYL59_01445 [Pseudomonas kairouanensis]|uniref:Type II toxin-antitoxin system RelE/ParE family toxin n=1 Tax=Pseudomonas kairouanensis TaxID=2293832 RepID=A0A4Z0B1S3_9PSED|nr:hypothetical protein DYL59_01445 [Pseudomonas kairouanensis]
MLIELAPAARVQLRQIIDYLSDLNPVAALEPNRAIETSVLALSRRPIRVLSVLHARQRYP